MQVHKTERGSLIRMSRGEKVIEGLVQFCEREGVKAATFSAIGAVRNCEIGYYSFEKREYFFNTITEDREVASMTGNVALVYPEETRGVDGPSTALRAGKPFVHAHAVLSAGDGSLSCIGGHVKEAEVTVTLEIDLTILGEPLERVYDEETGLKLWKI